MKPKYLLYLTALLPLSLQANSSEPNSALAYQQTTNTRIVVEENFLRFYTGGGERMTIDQNGNVGIGTIDPTQAQIHVYRNVNFWDVDHHNLSNAVAKFEDFKAQLYFSGSHIFGSHNLSLGTLNSKPIKLSTNETERMRITPEGLVGIGTTSPAAKLEVKTGGSDDQVQKWQVGDANSDYLEVINATGSNGQFIPALKGFHTTDNRAALYLLAEADPINDNGNIPLMRFDSRLSNGVPSNRILFSWDSYGQQKMTLSSSGELHVMGNVRWPDYVFEDTYHLNKIEEVEKYIEKNHHLPNIPSAAEVKEKGIELVDMQAKLLQKIEELTLYVIEQNKKIENQSEKIENQNFRIKELEANQNKVKR